MDFTDDITEMLRSDIFEAQDLELARTLAERVRVWETAEPQAKELARVRVTSALVDALVPTAVAGNLAYGDTLVDLVHAALYEGLDLTTLSRRLHTMLSEYESSV